MLAQHQELPVPQQRGQWGELYSSQAVIENNTFQDLGDGWYAIACGTVDLFPSLGGNAASGTGILGVSVPGGTLTGTNTWNKPGSSFPYFLNGELALAESGVWTIDPGVTVETDGRRVMIYGSLYASGTTNAPITFTSGKSSPAAGDWKGIYRSPNSGASVLNQCTMRFAGKDNLGYLHWGYRRAAVYVDSCSATMTGCTVLDGAADEVAMYASQATVRNNAFRNLGDGWHAVALHSMDCFPILGDNTTAAPQPAVDLLVRREQDTRYLGGDIINSTGDGQAKAMEIEPGQAGVFAVQLVNSGNPTDSFVLRGGSSAGWAVRYLDALTGTNDLTAQAAAGGLTIGPFAIGAATELRLVVTAGTDFNGSATNQFLVSAVSTTDTTKSDTIKIVALIVTNTSTPQSGVYTLDADFEKGVLNGVEHQTAHDQLQLTREPVTLPFICVPNSNEGTLSKVDTRTGRELGRYRTGPTSGGSPSRTTVDHEGNCWVVNRVTGTVIKIGLYENGQYVDRNGNGTIETSRDANGDGDITGDKILPWGQDESVLAEIVLIPG